MDLLNKNDIINFMNGFDFSLLPVGPQADVITKLEDLNNSLPYEFTDSYIRNKRKYPNIEFSVTKKFNWSRGTIAKTKLVKDVFDGIDTPHRSLGAITNLWERPENRRHQYGSKQFKDKIYDLERTLKRKRWNNAIWLDDSDELEALIGVVKENIVNSFIEFKNYVETTPGIDSKCHLEYENVTFDNSHDLFNRRIQEMWKLDNNDSYILFSKYNGSNNQEVLDASRIYILHQFPDTLLNVFHGDETTQPMLKVPIGKVIITYELDVKTLINYALGNTKISSRRWHTGNRFVKAYHRPIYNGLKHPFINVSQGMGGNSTANHIKILLEDCKITYDNAANNCAGNIDFVKYIKKLSFTSWAEDMYAWSTTYRVGTTHPLNNLSRTYYGHPKKIDPNMKDVYLETQGFDSRSCFDNLRGTLAHSGYGLIKNGGKTNIPYICQNYCFEDIRKKCNGFKRVSKELQIEEVRELFTNKDPLYLDSFLTVEPPSQSALNGLDVVIPLSEEEHTLERDMINWLTTHNN